MELPDLPMTYFRQRILCSRMQCVVKVQYEVIWVVRRQQMSWYSSDDNVRDCLWDEFNQPELQSCVANMMHDYVKHHGKAILWDSLTLRTWRIYEALCIVAIYFTVSCRT